MRGRTRLAALLAGAVVAVAPVAAVAARGSGSGQQAGGADSSEGAQRGAVAHVLLISVDGLHQSDLRWYVQGHRGSALAQLAHGGAQYMRAQTPVPSDSLPGMVGQVTGGDPATSGVYYDASYNHKLLPAGTTSCTGQPTGAEVNYFENLDLKTSLLDAGQGLSGLPGHPGSNDGIMLLTGKPQWMIDPAQLPVNPKKCTPVYPHQYLKVNTVFEVLHNRGLLTAWSDKHPAYEILNGPSGRGIDDLFTPEINSKALKPDGTAWGGDWTKDNGATRQYDSYKVQAVINQIHGFDHSGTNEVGVPAIFGMNFQSISTAQKLPVSVSDGLAGGYVPGTTTPGPLMRLALDYINSKVGSMLTELQKQGLLKSTAIILSAKHGQSPQDPKYLTRIDDAPIVQAINEGWKAMHHGAGNLVAADNTADSTAAAGSRDDAFPLWLTDRSEEATQFVKRYLLSHSATGTTYNTSDPAVAGPSRTLPSSGLSQLYTGEAAARYFGVPVSDPRHPDVWGVVQHGVVYTGGVGKIAEHGGADPEDRDVPLVVYAPDAVKAGVSTRWVETTQIAPTILTLLGFDPSSLRAVRIEGTQTLPGLRP